MATKTNALKPGAVTPLAIELVPLADLQPHPSNPRNGDTDAITESIRVNGVYRPLVVARDGTILAGNHSYASLMELGQAKANIVRLDIDPNSAAAKRIMLADNRTSDLGRYDDAGLLTLLQEVNETESLLGTGWADYAVDDLMARIEEAGSIDLNDVSNTRYTHSFEQDKELYADRAQRLLILTLPPPVYAWLVTTLEAVAVDRGTPDASNTDVIMALVAEAGKTEVPVL